MSIAPRLLMTFGASGGGGGGGAIDPDVLWLDASNVSSITEVGGKVSQWNDLSGNSNHATQGTAGSRGTRKTDYFSSGAIEFTGSTGMSLASSVTLSGGKTVFIVGRTITSSGTTFLGLASGTAIHVSDRYVGFVSANGAQTGRMQSVGTSGYSLSNASSTATGLHVMEHVLDTTPGAASHLLDGTSQSLTIVGSGWGTYTVNTICLQSSYLGGGMQIAEIRVYSTALSSGDRSTIRAALKTKWGTP